MHLYTYRKFSIVGIRFLNFFIQHIFQQWKSVQNCYPNYKTREARCTCPLCAPLLCPTLCTMSTCLTRSSTVKSFLKRCLFKFITVFRTTLCVISLICRIFFHYVPLVEFKDRRVCAQVFLYSYLTPPLVQLPDRTSSYCDRQWITASRRLLYSFVLIVRHRPRFRFRFRFFSFLFYCRIKAIILDLFLFSCWYFFFLLISYYHVYCTTHIVWILC